MREPLHLLYRLAALAVVAMCFAIVWGPQPVRAAPAADVGLPSLAGGTCGILHAVPMPEVQSELYYWRCANGREHYFHVRKGWTAETQNADDKRAMRAELLKLQELARTDKTDAKMRDAKMRALTKVRGQTV
jgi:hypothetical protein